MALNLMYITNRPEVATIAQNSGVDRIFLDMEIIGKEARQSGMDTVKSHHTVQDVKAIRKVIDRSELLVRVNPLHEADEKVGSSVQEIEDTIEAGADIIMLPMLKTARETERFVRIADGRVKTMLLIETAEANENIDEILRVEGVDEIHVGLNDLHLAYGKKFMFELLADGTVDRLCEKFSTKGLPYGFGGIARLGYGLLPAEKVIMEHYRLGSTRAILSRSFCNAEGIQDIIQLRTLFDYEMARIRDFENLVELYDVETLKANQREVVRLVEKIARK